MKIFPNQFTNCFSSVLACYLHKYVILFIISRLLIEPSKIVVLNVVGSSPICHPQGKRKIGNGSPLFRYMSIGRSRDIQEGAGGKVSQVD